MCAINSVKRGYPPEEAAHIAISKYVQSGGWGGGSTCVIVLHGCMCVSPFAALEEVNFHVIFVFSSFSAHMA